MKYYERNLELRREDARIMLYNDNNDRFRVYNGMRLVYDGDDHGMAYRVYNREV